MSSEQLRWVLGGGLASGKSQVRRFLDELGVCTIDADRVGHEVLRSDGPAFAEIVRRWPQVVKDGEIHRPSLASIVFNDTSELTALERISHPYIFDRINARVEGLESPVVVEIPVLCHGLGAGWKRMVVDCRDELRRRRAIDRGMSPVDVRSRMTAQPNRVGWLVAADLVVPNHSTIKVLRSTVERMIPTLWTRSTGQCQA